MLEDFVDEEESDCRSVCWGARWDHSAKSNWETAEGSFEHPKWRKWWRDLQTWFCRQPMRVCSPPHFQKFIRCLKQGLFSYFDVLFLNCLTEKGRLSSKKCNFSRRISFAKYFRFRCSDASVVLMTCMRLNSAYPTLHFPCSKDHSGVSKIDPQSRKK